MHTSTRSSIFKKCDEIRIGKQLATVMGGFVPFADRLDGAQHPSLSVALMYRISHENIWTSQCTVISIG